MRYAAVYILAVLIFVISGATFEDIISDKRRQIEIINSDINNIRIKLSRNDDSLRFISKRADSIKTELNAIDKFLEDYKNQHFLTPLEVAQETNMILFLEEEIQNLQKSFRNKVINLYKHGKNYELELLLSSRTPNEYLRRNQYLQKFSQNRKKELSELNTNKFILEEKKKLLSLSVSSQRYYIEAKRSRKSILDSLISGIRKDSIMIMSDNEKEREMIKFKERQLSSIRTFISNLQDNYQTFSGMKVSRINYPSDDMNQLQGLLNIPLDFMLVTNKFGESKNNYTNTNTFNNGIDFSISRGSKVYAVAGGTITLTSDIPYYGKVIVITHGNGFRTLYAKLESIEVETGSTVRNNQIIARSGENIDGQGLHFELWQGMTPLDPLQWLKTKN